MTTTLILEPPCAFLNANDRHHWRTRAHLTAVWRGAAAEAATEAGVKFHKKAHLVISYRFATNHRREVQNVQPTSKAICDGLVDAFVFEDDSDDHVVGPDNRRTRPNGTPQVTITIEELP